MAIFKRTLLADAGVARIETECLGDNNQQYASRHIGALVVMAANSYVAPAAGADIEGQIVSMEVATVNDGFSYGSVKKSHRLEVMLGANADTVNVVVGDTVVCDVQPTLAVGGMGTVKKGAGALHKWQVIALSGAGTTGDTAIIQKV